MLERAHASAVLVQHAIESPVRDVVRARGIPVIEVLACLKAEAGIFRLLGAGWQLANAAPVRAENTALLLHTSGTTSRPKLVPLTHANLCASAANIAWTLRLGPGDRCLNVMPLFHIHGLASGLTARLLSGGSVVCTAGFDAEGDLFLAGMITEIINRGSEKISPR